MTKKEHKQRQEKFLNALRLKYAKQETNEVLSNGNDWPWI